MPKVRFDHVALLVRDLKKSVDDYRSLLSILDPVNSSEIVWEDGQENGFKYQAATFVSKNGQTVFQLIQSENPKDQERLRTHGEGIHHLEFCAPDVREVQKQLQSANIPVVSEKTFVSQSIPWQEFVLVSPKKTHGVLVKIATQYRVMNGKWTPDE